MENTYEISVKAEEEWETILKNLPNNSAGNADIYDIWAKERRKLVKKYKELPTLPDENNQLLKLKNKYKGERVFLLGNGPSLNKIPFDLLKNEYTFGVNRIYLMFDRTSWRPSFYTINDWEVGPDNAKEINQLEDMVFFCPTRFRSLFKPKCETYFYNSRNRRNEDDLFSYDLQDGAVMGGTVMSLTIQIAHYLGFDPVYLIGVDVDYKVLETVKQDGKKFSNGVRQFLESTEDDDPNHFDKRYFGKGKKWHNPNVENMIDGFTIARRAFESSNRQILNATIGGKLEALERVDFHSLFANPKKEPLVSVIMPAYNAQKHIARSIKSLLDQNYTNWQLIIVNDGSTDNTKKLIEAYSDERIVCVNQENQGRSSARNRALDIATGKYIAFLDADDVYSPEKLQVQVSFLEGNRNIDIAVGQVNRINEKGVMIRDFAEVKEGEIISPSFLKGNPVHMIGVLLKAATIGSYRFKIDAKAGEDWDYFLEIAADGHIYYRHFVSAGSYRMTKQAIQKTTKEYAQRMINVLDRFYNNPVKSLRYSEYKDESYIHSYVRMASRLFACKNISDGQFFLNKALALWTRQTEKFYRYVSRQIIFWLIHLDVDNIYETIDNILDNLSSKYDRDCFARELKRIAKQHIWEGGETSVRKANEYYREEKYNKALAAYIDLKESNSFYGFLDLNIELTQKKMT